MIFTSLKKQDKYKLMTETPIPKLISYLALPTVLSMLVTSVYNMADTYFIGHIPGATQSEITSATGAVAVVFSLMAIIQACGFFFGQGSGSYISRELGNKNREGAEKMASFAFFVSLFVGALIGIFGLIFIEPLAYFLGSTDTILPYAKDYMFYILIGAPFMCGSFVLNNQMRFQGNAYISMIGIISGAGLNIILDYVFVLKLGMGTAGAGLATAIGQFVGFVVLFVGMRVGNNLKLKVRMFRFSSVYLKEVVRGGLPSLARQGLASIGALSLNYAGKLCGGDTVISAMGIVSRVMNFAFSAVLGFGQGFQPVCGYNFGAKKYERVKEGFFFSLKISMTFLIVVLAVLIIFSTKIIGMFNADELVLPIGKAALISQCAAFVFVPFITYTNMLLQVIGKVVPATLLSMGRQGVFFLPVLVVFTWLFKTWGVILSQPIADLLTFVFAVVLFIKEYKELNLLEKLRDNEFENEINEDTQITD